MKRFKNFPVINVITIFVIPYILLYAIYIQINGEVSPGGGFQAGAVFASGLIALEVIYGSNLFKHYISLNALIVIAIIGVIIYASTGFIPLFFNSNYLNYYTLASDRHLAQETGIFLIETGVGFTVSSVICLIYSIFQIDL